MLHGGEEKCAAAPPTFSHIDGEGAERPEGMFKEPCRSSMLPSVALGPRPRRQPHCLDLLVTCYSSELKEQSTKTAQQKQTGGGVGVGGQGQALKQMAVSGGVWSSNRGSRSQQRSRGACAQKTLSTSQDGSLTNPAVWAQRSQDAERRAGILEERRWWGKGAGCASFLFPQARVSSGTGNGRLLLVPPYESKSGRLAAPDGY